MDDLKVQDADTVGIRSVNEKIASDTRVTSTLVPIHDGMTVAVKKKQYSSGKGNNYGVFAGKVISLEGNIASGKTSLLRKIAREEKLTNEIETQIFFESPIETFLDLFYTSPDR